jgi:predicted RNase H-like HicB family nuclease
MQYDVLIYRDTDSDLYLAEVPDLPGCMSQGPSIEETKANIREAIEAHVATLRDLGRGVPLPSPHVLESVEIDVA